MLRNSPNFVGAENGGAEVGDEKAERAQHIGYSPVDVPSQYSCGDRGSCGRENEFSIRP